MTEIAPTMYVLRFQLELNMLFKRTFIFNLNMGTNLEVLLHNREASSTDYKNTLGPCYTGTICDSSSVAKCNTGRCSVVSH